MLNISGSFANQQLRKLYALAGAALPTLSEDIQLVQALDPERLQPYGQWRRAMFGFGEDTVLAQPYSFGIINPLASGSIVVVERVSVSVASILQLNGAITSTLDVALGSFVPVDDTEPSTPSCPINWFRNTVRASSGSLINWALLLSNTMVDIVNNPIPLYPGRELNWGVSPAAPTRITYQFLIRWLSPTP